MPPWKLRAQQEPEWYNAADSDVTLCCYNGIRASLEAQQRWDMYEKHFVEVDTVLRAMSARGIHVDGERRRANREHFKKRYDETCEDAQPYYPLELRRRKLYTYGEERLKKQGLWEEGAMLKVKVKGPPPEKYVVGADGFLERKKKNAVRAKRGKGKRKVPSQAGRRKAPVRPDDAVQGSDDLPASEGGN
jgi:hypothetical protein